MIPSLDGSYVFGRAVKMSTSDNPRSRQQNAYPGLSGVEALDMGLRGRFTSVTGRLYGTGAAGLAAAQETLRGFNDGQAHTLIDTSGTTWLNVFLDAFEPQGDRRIDFTSGVAWQAYSARLWHQT